MKDLCAIICLMLIALPTPAATHEAPGADHPRIRQMRPDTRFSGEPPGQAVYEVLLAEFALRRGDPQLAASIWADLARNTREAKVFERAVDAAGFVQRYDLALDLASDWLVVAPQSKEAQQALASAMIFSGKIDELPPLLIEMLEADKTVLGQNLLGLNRMLSRIPDKQHVFQVIDRVCQPFFGIVEAHYAVAVAAATAGEYQRGLIEVRKAMELRPDWELGAILQAKILVNFSPADSIASLFEFLGNTPQAQEARLHLARSLIGEKRLAEARQQFDILQATSPDNPEVIYPIAILALEHNELALAESHLKHFMTLRDVDKNPARYYLGQLAEENGRTQEALNWYADVTSGEHYTQAQLRRARLLFAEGRFDEARAQLRTAKMAAPADQRVPLSIAEAGLLRDMKQPQAAFDLLEELLVKNPDQPDLLYETSLLAEKLDKIELMETRLRRLIQLRPEMPQAYNALGYSLADRKLRLTEARQLIEKALSLAPDDYFILDSMGWVLYRLGVFDDARRYLEQAFLRHNDPEIAAHLGEVLWAQDRKTEARKLWLDMRKKHPSSEALEEVIRRFGVGE